MSEKRNLVGWKAWYALDGKITVYKSNETKFDELPQEGIQWLKRYWHYPDRTQNKIIPEDVTGQDVFSLNNCELQKTKPVLPDSLKLGVLLPSSEFGKLFKTCKADGEIISEMV